MPEGDTIHHAANRIRAVLEGRTPESIATPHPRFARDRWPERLARQPVTAVDAHGKHLHIRFANALVIHSHLRMTGQWRVRASTDALPPRTWLAIRTQTHDVLQLNGPLLELLTESRARQQRATLGPDILAPTFDAPAFLQRLRADDPTRGIGDALLDQRTLAGIGNIWKAESCFAAGIDPWRRTGDVTDEEALRLIDLTRPRMQQSAATGRLSNRIYGKQGRPCPRCGTPIEARRQGDDNRTTYWCPGCQR